MPWIMQYNSNEAKGWLTDIDEDGNDELWYDYEGAVQAAKDRTKHKVYNSEWRVREADDNI